MTSQERLHAAQVPSYGAAPLHTAKQRQWEELGSPWAIFFRVAAGVGKQYVALALVAAQVTTSKEYLMNCNPHDVGLLMSIGCEYTKASVRCFPLLGMIVTLLVAARWLLHHRIYYEILKHGVICDFENFVPLSDPLFQLLMVYLGGAGLHFLLSMWWAWDLSLNPHNNSDNVHKIASGNFLDEVQSLAVFYFAPAVVFMMFLYDSYDTEAMLLPLSKYFEEDPAWARMTLGQAPLIAEAAAATVTREGIIFGASGGRSSGSTRDVYSELTKRALVYGEGGLAQESGQMCDPPPPLSRWRLVSTLWPARVLLDKRLDDEDSRKFRRVWFCFVVFAGVMIIWACFWICFRIAGDIEDVFVKGYRTDAPGLFVEIVTAVIVVFLARSFWLNVSVPRNDPPGPDVAALCRSFGAKV